MGIKSFDLKTIPVYFQYVSRKEYNTEVICLESSGNRWGATCYLLPRNRRVDFITYIHVYLIIENPESAHCKGTFRPSRPMGVVKNLMDARWVLPVIHQKLRGLWTFMYQSRTSHETMIWFNLIWFDLIWFDLKVLEGAKILNEKRWI